MPQFQNPANKDIFDGTMIYATDSTGVQIVNQGDIVVFDASLNAGNGGIRSAVVQADLVLAGGGYAGIAMQQSFVQSLGDKLSTIEIGFKCVWNFVSTPGETYKHGMPVFFNETGVGGLGINNQVTNSTNTGARTIKVGYVILPNEQLMSGNLTVLGATGTTISVAVVATFPAVSLA